jgi:hypothetical protein
MADKETPSGLSAFEKTNPMLGAGAINPYSLGVPELKELADAQESIIQSLQMRYAQPNWFKVAEGFAKPQLGGFMASLGSAAGALGENVEQQRAAELPLAQMRAQLAATKLTMGQRQRAAEEAELAANSPNALTPEKVAHISNLDRSLGPILQQQLENQGKIRKEILDQRALGRTEAELITLYGNDFYKLFPSGVQGMPAIPGSQATSTGSPAANALSSPTKDDNKKPSWFTGTQAQWDNTPLASKAELGKAAEEAGLATAKDQLVDYRTRAENANRAIPNLKAMYQLAAKPNMAGMLGVFEKGDILGAVGKALESGSFPALLAGVRKQLTNANPNTTEADISDLHTLMQTIARNQLNVRQGQANPSDYATEIDALAGPSIADPQDSFLRKTALALHDTQHELKNYTVYQSAIKNNIRPEEYVVSDPFRTFNDEHQRQHTLLATTRLGPGAKLPDFLDSSTVSAKSPTPASRSGSSQPSGSSMAERIRAEKARQDALRPKP